jgi:hypothetical protein
MAKKVQTKRNLLRQSGASMRNLLRPSSASIKDELGTGVYKSCGSVAVRLQTIVVRKAPIAKHLKTTG